VAEQVRQRTGQQGASGNFFTNFVEGSGREGALRELLNRHAQAAGEPTAESGRWLEDELAPRGRGSEACWREVYCRGSRYFLGTTIDLEETYDWG
jgi:hypothetical protein